MSGLLNRLLAPWDEAAGRNDPAFLMNVLLLLSPPLVPFVLWVAPEGGSALRIVVVTSWIAYAQAGVMKVGVPSRARDVPRCWLWPMYPRVGVLASLGEPRQEPRAGLQVKDDLLLKVLAILILLAQVLLFVAGAVIHVTEGSITQSAWMCFVGASLLFAPLVALVRTLQQTASPSSSR